MFIPHYMTYIDNAGKCQVEYFSGSAWGHIQLGDGGFGLTGGLDIQHQANWVFARRNDGAVVWFYYQ